MNHDTINELALMHERVNRLTAEIEHQYHTNDDPTGVLWGNVLEARVHLARANLMLQEAKLKEYHEAGNAAIVKDM